MRKAKFILLSAFLLCMEHVWAGNSLFVRDVIIAKNGAVGLAIETDFEKEDFIGYQFDVTLPKGLAFKLNSSHKVETTSYTKLDIDGSVISSSETSTTYRLLASKTGNPRIPSGSYVLLTMVLESDGSLNVDDVKECSLTGIKFSDSSQQKTEVEDVNFNVTISDKVVLDENYPAVPEATTGEVDILVKRTIKANQWSTICLPFKMTEAQVYSAFGNGVQVAEFKEGEKGYEVKDDGSIEVSFINTVVSGTGVYIYANWPYIIKTSTDISEFEVKAKITPNEEGAVDIYATTGKEPETLRKFIGTFHAGTIIPQNNLFLSDNKFYYSVGKTKCKAFRAYFWFKDVLADLNSAGSRITLQFNDDSTTGIRNLRGEETDATIYDLQGRRVKKQSKGLYIVNNKKVVIK